MPTLSRLRLAEGTVEMMWTCYGFCTPIVPFLTLLLLCTPSVEGQQPNGEVTIAGSHVHEMVSESGLTYRIFVSVPAGDPPPEGFPVFYLLDGNAYFGTATEILRHHAQPRGGRSSTSAVVVGAGYPTDAPFDHARRAFDFTPETKPELLPQRRDGSGWYNAGGNTAFLSFLTDELQPLIEREYPVNPDKSSLFGHSLGGLLVLHTMFERPEAFSTYIAASPSIWWGGEAILGELDAFAERVRKEPLNTPVRVLVTVGSEEAGDQGPAATIPAYDVKIPMGAGDLVERIGSLQLEGVTTEFAEFGGESHGSVIPAALNRGIRFAVSNPGGGAGRGD